MARAKEIIDGLNILLKYCKEPKDTVVQAEHDIFYGPDIVDVSEEDKSLLEGLGWFVDEECDCWAHFT